MSSVDQLTIELTKYKEENNKIKLLDLEIFELVLLKLNISWFCIIKNQKGCLTSL